MAFRVKIGEGLVLENDNVTSVDFKTITDENSTSRSATIVNDIVIKGTVLNDLNDRSIEVLMWANSNVGSESIKEVTVTVFQNNIVTREYVCPSTFVISHVEESVSNGDATVFTTHLRQQTKDRSGMELSGAYSEETAL